jgi:hypothetical protein
MLTALPKETFLWADWGEESLRKLFNEDVELPAEALAIHLWESHAWEKHLSQLTPERVVREDTTFNRLARRFIPDAPGRSPVITMGKNADLDFTSMDEICAEVNFVREKKKVSGAHRKAARILGKLGSIFKKFVKTDFLKQSAVSLGKPNEMLSIFREHHPRRPFAAVIFSDADSDPAILRELENDVHAHFVWVFSDLRKAYGLTERLKQNGNARGRSIYADTPHVGHAIHDLLRSSPDLLVDARQRPNGDTKDWIEALSPNFYLRCGGMDQAGRKQMEQGGFSFLRHSGYGSVILFGQNGAQCVHNVTPEKIKRMTSIYGDEVLITERKSQAYGSLVHFRPVGR